MYKDLCDIAYELNNYSEINISEEDSEYLYENINEPQGQIEINPIQQDYPYIVNSINNMEENKNIISQSNANINSIPNEDKKKLGIFQVVYPKKSWLFNFSKSDSELKIPIYIKKKLSRSKKNQRKKRGRNQDNLLIRMKRHFFNNALTKSLNEELDKIGFKIKFEKFPSTFTSDVKIENNKKIIDKTLKEIFEMKELYISIDKELRGDKNKAALDKYNHNLEIILKLEKENNLNVKNVNKVLNMKYRDIYQNYIKGDEFINYVNELKSPLKKFDDSDLVRFIDLAKYFIQYFSE